MSELTKETVEEIANLCRIECTEEEKASLLKDLGKILNYVDQLREVDTSEVPPCSHVIPGINNVMREDNPKNTLARDAFMDNAPSPEARIAGMIKVPTILNDDS